MLGIDITKISRFNNKSISFAKRILHDDEYLLWEKVKNKTRFLASRWAIKEAIYKANNSYKIFSEINIKMKNDKYIFNNFKISTSEESDIYIAIAMEEK